MPIKRKIQTVKGIKKYYYIYISPEGNKYKKWFYDKNNEESRLDAWILCVKQRTAIKAKQSNNNKCWFE